MPSILIRLLPLLSLGLGVGLFFAGSPAWWFGAGICVATLVLVSRVEAPALSRLGAWLSRPRRLGRFELVPATLLQDLLCVAILVVVATALLPYAAQGDWPTNHDHPVHLFKAWQLVEHFLEEGSIRGWSHLWYAGYPPQYLYPFGADLFIAGVWAAGLGFLSFGQAYGIAFYLFWLLQGLALFAVGRVGFSRWVGLLAGIAYMSDSGDFRAGGWIYAAEWGVWPMNFALALGMLAVALLPRVVEGKRWRDVGLFGLLAGISLISHPLQLLHLAALVPVAVVAFLVSASPAPRLVGLARLGLGSAIAAMIGSLWLMPFLSVKDEAQSYGEPWHTAFGMGDALYDASLLSGTWVVVGVLGLVGAIAWLSNLRRFMPVFMGWMIAVFLLAGSTTLMVEFHLVELSRSFDHLQLERFAVLLKPYWMVAAAYALVEGLRALLSAARRRSGAEDGAPLSAMVIHAFLITSIVAPVVLGFFHTYGVKQLNRHLIEASDRAYRSDREKLVSWARENHEEVGDEGFYRFALLADGHDHSFTDLGIDLPAPLYKVGFTPASVFQYKMEASSPRYLDALNVRYVIGVKRSRTGKIYEEVAAFGDLKVYEYKGWRPEPFEVIEGEGEVELVRFERELIELRVKEGAQGKLRLNVSHFSRWHATRDGEPVEITTTSLKGSDADQTGFMTVPLKAGTYRFVFESGAAERAANLLFGLGLVLVFLLWSADLDRRPVRRLGAALARVTAWLTRLERRFARPFAAAALIAVGLGAGAALLLSTWTPALPDTTQEEGDEEASAAGVEATDTEIIYDFAEAMRTAQVSKRRTGATGRGKNCYRVFDRFVCGNDLWEHVFRHVVSFEDDRLTRCIWAHPLRNKDLIVTFRDVPLDRASRLAGFYGIAETGYVSRHKPVELQVAVDGVEVWKGTTKKDKQLHHFDVELDAAKEEAEVSFVVSAEDTGRRHFCFNVQALE